MTDQPEKKPARGGGNRGGGNRPGGNRPGGSNRPGGTKPGGNKPGGDRASGSGGDDKPRRDRDQRPPREDDREELDERVVDIKRVAKVIKGGRRFAFRTVVIVGDGKGRVGVGIGKARGVPDAIRKGAEHARRNMTKVALAGETIPHPVTAEYGGAVVLLRPAAPGTGVIAGGSVRAVVEAVGIHNILTKSQGSNNVLNVTMATLTALEQLRTPQEIAAMRGKDPADLVPFWERKRQE
jgi:small subunit ribosomal protein S5